MKIDNNYINYRKNMKNIELVWDYLFIIDISNCYRVCDCIFWCVYSILLDMVN